MKHREWKFRQKQLPNETVWEAVEGPGIIFGETIRVVEYSALVAEKQRSAKLVGIAKRFIMSKKRLDSCDMATSNFVKYNSQCISNFSNLIEAIAAYEASVKE